VQCEARGEGTGRDALREHLRACGIGSDVHYPVPDHRQPVFGPRFADVHLPHTERLCREILTLPCHSEMAPDAVQTVIDAVNAWPA
jgi:dTDP-4-amino-4,6-dideoxygalactose transaminase